jgi:hypothetical protein
MLVVLPDCMKICQSLYWQGQWWRPYGKLAVETRMTAEKRFLSEKIACREAIFEDRSVSSRQWIEIPHIDKALLTPALLVESFMSFIRKFTLSIIRPVQNGGKTAFALFGSSLHLLVFSGAEFSSDDRSQSANLRIEGGLLVQRNESGKGVLSFIIEEVDEGLKVAVQLSDYCPLLLGGRKPSKIRRWVYLCTQALVHKIITSRFLYHLYHQLESRKSF